MMLWLESKMIIILLLLLIVIIYHIVDNKQTNKQTKDLMSQDNAIIQN